MILTRRSFLTGLLAAPIIVRPGLVMPIKPLAPLFTAEDVTWTASPGVAFEKCFIIYSTDRFGQPIQERIPLDGNGVHPGTLKFHTITAIS